MRDTLVEFFFFRGRYFNIIFPVSASARQSRAQCCAREFPRKILFSGSLNPISSDFAAFFIFFSQRADGYFFASLRGLGI